MKNKDRIKNNTKQIFIAALFVCISMALWANVDSELGNDNLKGLNYIMVEAEFNGIVYGEGHPDPEEEKIVEYNLPEVENRLKENNVPINKEMIRSIYKLVSDILTEADMRILKVKLYDKTTTTVIPTLTVKIDTISKSNDIHFAVVSLVLSKWMSNWSGGERIHAPVYTWYGKRMVVLLPKELEKTGENEETTENDADAEETKESEPEVSPTDELIDILETTVTELANQFIEEYKDANAEETPEVEDKKNTSNKSGKKNIKPKKRKTESD